LRAGSTIGALLVGLAALLLTALLARLLVAGLLAVGLLIAQSLALAGGADLVLVGIRDSRIGTRLLPLIALVFTHTRLHACCDDSIIVLPRGPAIGQRQVCVSEGSHKPGSMQTQKHRGGPEACPRCRPCSEGAV
jgi:hypothetical protein